ncbi:hypothetical protein JCM30471_23050 [Desulfuromonas carbonis]|uniref:hypothetical protein n=1 Tax=Desulfuromonas sp. DDH964 TaxID=1823759 RepID=UPI00078B50B1|nr:hypothetical protein [Desulfuromonas sp. DDH964]AMV73884.1 diguanylate cyclase [Desulfuromonas sp. DDH964]
MGRRNGIATERVYTGGRHQDLLKLFTLATLVSLLAILLLVGFGIYQIFNRYIIAEAERDAVAISNAIIGDSLKDYIARGPGGAPTLIIPASSYHLLDQDIEAKLKYFDVLKIKIFSRDQAIVYSNDRNIIGELDLKNQTLAAALAGDASSKLEKKEELWDLADEKKYEIDMVETYMPLRTPTGVVAGAFEIYMDVSAYRQLLRDVLVAAILVVTAVLLVVFGVLTFYMRKATRIISSKTQEIRVLSGLLPICSACKKIRNDHDEWEILEKFITERSESEFTHSLCPDCLQEYWKE